MSLISALILLMLTACESRQSHNVSGNTPEGAKLIASIEEREKLHDYQVRVRWQGMGNLKPTLKRQAGSRPAETIGKITAPEGEIIDQSVREGESYTFFLDNMTQTENSSVTVKVPRDFDSDDLKGTPFFVALLGYGRVAIRTLRSHGDIHIIAQKLIAKGYGSIVTNAPEEPAEEGKVGANARKITIATDELVGPFALYANGQRGGPAKKGAAGEIVVPAGKGGKSGPIEVTVKKKGQFDLTVILAAAWGGADNKIENLGGCEPIYLRLPENNNLVANCQYLSPGWEGIYSVNGEHWMLAPAMNNFRVHVSPQDEIQLEWKGVPTQWAGGMGIGFRSYGNPPQIYRNWGKYINSNMAYATPIRSAERTGSLEKLQNILDSLGRLAKALPQITVNTYFQSGVILDFEKMTSVEMISSFESKSTELLAALKLRKMNTLYFQFGAEARYGDSIKEFPGFVVISGNPKMTATQIIEGIEKETIPKGVVK